MDVLDRDRITLDADPDQQRKRLDEARLRLLDAIAELKPPSMEHVEVHVIAALRELTSVQQELRLLLHVRHLEETGLEDQIADLEEKLAGGWEPPAEPVEDLVASLKGEFGLD